MELRKTLSYTIPTSASLCTWLPPLCLSLKSPSPYSVQGQQTLDLRPILNLGYHVKTLSYISAKTLFLNNVTFILTRA